MSARLKQRILIVDDEVSFGRLLKLNLEQAGPFEVRTESQGSRALPAAEEFAPDLILLDVIMPDLDGGAVAAQLQAHPRLKNVPIVFLTAVVSRDEASAQEGIIGGHPFLAKPVNLPVLLECVQERLGARSAASSSRNAVSVAASSKRRILLIDDEQSFSKLLKLNLEASGDYECLLAHSGEDGCRMALELRPHLVLCDMMMPGLSGVETLKRIKASAPGMPVAMVTAVWNADEAKRAFEAGAFEYITKPVDFEHLKTAVFAKLF